MAMEEDQEEHRKKTQMLMIVVCSVLLVVMVVAVTVGISREYNAEDTSNGSKDQVSTSSKAINAFCQPADYQKTCVEQLKKEIGNKSTEPRDLTKLAFTIAIKHIELAANKSILLQELEKDPRTQNALRVCKDLMSFSVSELDKAFDRIGEMDLSKADRIVQDLKVWLTATITNGKACLDGFQNTSSKAGEKMAQALNLGLEMSKNALAVVDEMGHLLAEFGGVQVGSNRRRLLRMDPDDDTEALGLGHGLAWEEMVNGRRRLMKTTEKFSFHGRLPRMLRRLLQIESDDDTDVPVLGHGLPWEEMVNGRRRLKRSDKSEPPKGEGDRWMERRLLMAAGHEHNWLKPEIIVAQDGSGNFTTINQALQSIPKDHNRKRMVIYIKEGVYREKVVVDYSMVNMAWIGDGASKTRIVWDLSFTKNLTTFATATVSVFGDYFFARSIGFENSIGPTGYQAVALLVASDFSVFYKCSIDGYQDTLYVHSKRQFFRDCTLSGTIDYVFGNAAVVFQNCTFLSRIPLDNQQIAVTANGKFDQRQVGAIVIQNSTFIAEPGYSKDKFPAYLGRPWGNFSTTIIMESYIDDVIRPDGWAPWDKDWGIQTSFYAEYHNHGPGASTTSRVKWPAIKNLTEQEVVEYTAGKFIGADKWVRQISRVPYISGFVETLPGAGPVTQH